PPPQAQPRPGGTGTPPLARPPFVMPPPIQAFVSPPPQTAFVPPRIPIDPPGTRLPQRQRALPPRRLPTTVPPQGDVNRKRDREILIAMDDSVSDGDTLTIGTGLTLTVEVQYRSALLGVKLVRLRIPDNRAQTQVIQQVVQAGVTDPRIIAVQPNYVFETTQTVAATVSPQSPLPQYSADKVRLTGAHRVSLGRDVRVAVIDTGMDSAHPELAGVVLDSFDAIGEGPSEAEAHGTAIAGIVAARQQIKGMAPDARVLAVRAFSGGSGRKPEATTLSLIKGLDWAATNNARVVNMSFAGPKDAMLLEAIEQAESRGMIMVAAAGNGGPKAASAYPAAYERVIAVTASDSDDQLYDMANRGTYVAIAAPGVDILAPAPQASYEMSSGTSLAAAHVSGIIALMLERKPTLTSEDIRAILARTARDPDRSAVRRGLGAGIVDAAKAVGEAQ
ncbi:MAG: S8 family serine peptidase, partial [Hyphomicrobiaceae bacterium]